MSDYFTWTILNLKDKIILCFGMCVYLKMWVKLHGTFLNLEVTVSVSNIAEHVDSDILQPSMEEWSPICAMPVFIRFLDVSFPE